MQRGRKITCAEIEEGLRTVAVLIQRYGDVYWPIFERLEKELEVRQSRAARLRFRLRTHQLAFRSGSEEAYSSQMKYVEPPSPTLLKSDRLSHSVGAAGIIGTK